MELILIALVLVNLFLTVRIIMMAKRVNRISKKINTIIERIGHVEQESQKTFSLCETELRSTNINLENIVKIFEEVKGLIIKLKSDSTKSLKL